MKLLTRLKIFGAILTVTAAMGAYHLLFRVPPTQNSRDDERRILLVVAFEPQHRRDAARPQVRVFVDKVKIFDEFAITSEWKREIVLPRGRTVEIMAVQTVGAMIECAIWDGAQMPANQFHPGPGLVHCSYKW